MIRRTLLVLAFLVGLGGCTGEDPDPKPSSAPSATFTPSPAAAPATAAPRPANGSCFALSYEEAVASTTEVAATRCKAPHTARTFHVGTIEAVVDGHLLAVDSAQVQDAIATECPQRLGRYLGGDEETQRLSLLRAIWFSPSIEASDEGENWFRCDVIALAGDEELAPLKGPLKGALATENSFGMCGTADPESVAFERVICSAPHTWQAIASVDAPGRDVPGRDFPGLRSLRDDGTVACEDPARAVAPDPLTVTWSYEPPSRLQWQAGQQYGICWVPTD